MTTIVFIQGIEYCFWKEQYKNLFHQEIVIRSIDDTASLLSIVGYGLYFIEKPTISLISMMNNYDPMFLETLLNVGLPKSYLSQRRKNTSLHYA